jgi:cytidylate kinase
MKDSGKKKSKGRVVAIDGPAASGKSTTARLLAQKLGWLFLDTGAMYRAVTVKVLKAKIPLDDAAAIGAMAQNTTVELVPASNGTKVFVDQKDVTGLIRTPEVDRAIGPVCEVPAVRDIMVRLQRRLAAGKNVVAEGRDMGTIVFPNADLKIFMTASVEERVVRRQRDMTRQGLSVALDELMDDITRRDRRDSTRENSPLVPARDAVTLDTSTLSVDEQVQFIAGKLKVQ